MLGWLKAPETQKVSWSKPFAGRMLFHEGLPILSVVAAQLPIIPALLTDWLQPLVQLLTS